MHDHRRIAAVHAVLAEVGAERVPMIDVFNKSDMLEAGERARIAAVHPKALCVSALSGQGREDVIAAMETRLGLDTATVVFEFDPHDEADRAHIAELYRLGHVRRHVATDDRITIEADLPRRLADRFHREAADADA